MGGEEGTLLGHIMAKDIERTHVDHLGRSKMSPGNGFGEIDFSRKSSVFQPLGASRGLPKAVWEERGSAGLGHRMAKDIERTHVDHLGRSKMSPGNGFGEIGFS